MPIFASAHARLMRLCRRLGAAARWRHSGYFYEAPSEMTRCRRFSRRDAPPCYRSSRHAELDAVSIALARCCHMIRAIEAADSRRCRHAATGRGGKCSPLFHCLAIALLFGDTPSLIVGVSRCCWAKPPFHYASGHGPPAITGHGRAAAAMLVAMSKSAPAGSEPAITCAYSRLSQPPLLRGPPAMRRRHSVDTGRGRVICLCRAAARC